MYGFGNKHYGFVSGEFHLAQEAEQYLYALESPATVLDKTASGLNATIKGSPRITLNGSDQYGTFDELLDFSEGQNFEISFKTDVSQTGYVFSQLGNSTITENAECKIIFITGGLNVIFNGASTGSLSGYGDGRWHTVSFTVGNISTDVYIDDVFISTLTHGNPWVSTTAFIGAKYGPGTFFEGSVCCAGGHPICEQSGTTSYAVDGNGNDITWEVGSGSDTVMWSGTQDEYHYLATHGGSKVLVFDGVTGYADTGVAMALGDSDYSGSVTFISRGVLPANILDGREANDVGVDIILLADGRLFFQHNAEDIAFAGPYNDGRVHTLLFSRAGDVLTVTVNDEIKSRTGLSPLVSTNNIIIGRRNYELSSYFDGVVISAAVDCCFGYYASNAYDTTLPDSSGNGNDAMLVDVDYKYYPALSDGSDDVAGLGITNPGGYLWNGGPQYLEQYAANASVLGHSGLWYDVDGVTPLQVYYADAKAWVNFTDNTLVNFNTLSNGTCVGDKAAIYAEDKTFTIAEYNRISAVMPNTCGADGLELEYDADGSVEINADGSVELVQPE